MTISDVMKNFLEKKWVELTLAISILGVGLLCVFTPDTAIIRRGADFTAHLSILFLFLGMFFLVFDQRRLMFTSLITCAILSLFLKQESNSNLTFPEENLNRNITIAHINVSNAEQGYSEVLSKILEIKPDVISFQELTPDWDVQLKTQLHEFYPNINNLVRIDPYGMAIYSRFEILNSDTLEHNGIPNLKSTLDLGDDRKLNLISTYVLPSFDNIARLQIKEHFNYLAQKITKHSEPTILLGDFNLVYWSNEIRTLRNSIDLENSRRDISDSVLKLPYDHIFYTRELECTAFNDITGLDARHLGILGTYQWKSEEENETDYYSTVPR